MKLFKIENKKIFRSEEELSGFLNKYNLTYIEIKEKDITDDLRPYISDFIDDSYINWNRVFKEKRLNKNEYKFIKQDSEYIYFIKKSDMDKAMKDESFITDDRIEYKEKSFNPDDEFLLKFSYGELSFYSIHKNLLFYYKN